MVEKYCLPPLDEDGRCGATTYHAVADTGQQFFALNVIMADDSPVLIYGVEQPDSVQWVRHELKTQTTHPMFECSSKANCVSGAQWSDLELRPAKTALGRHYWRGVALTSTGSARTVVDYFPLTGAGEQAHTHSNQHSKSL